MANIDNLRKTIIKPYIIPHIWEGKLRIDGGFGTLNAGKFDNLGAPITSMEEAIAYLKDPKVLINNIPELDSDLYRGLDSPIYIEPFTAIEEDKDGEGNVVVKVIDSGYKLVFPGAHVDLFLSLMDAIAKVTTELQEYELLSYPSTKPPMDGEPFYKLNITVKDRRKTFSLVPGRWILSFENCHPMSQWSLEDGENIY